MIFGDFFYLRKSDRKVILAVLCVIAVALAVIFLTGGENDASNEVTAADSVRNDSAGRAPASTRYHRVDTIYLKPRYYRYPRGGRERYRQANAGGEGVRDSVVIYQPRHKIGEGEQVVLNTADTTALMTVPGIGSYYARRIAQYGQRLGGYVSVDQLDEIDDLPPGFKQYLRIENAQPIRLNVNRLSLNELRRHPYINFYMAKAITEYRRLHGPLKSLEDLRLSKDFPPEVIARLTPYVEF